MFPLEKPALFAPLRNFEMEDETSERELFERKFYIFLKKEIDCYTDRSMEFKIYLF